MSELAIKNLSPTASDAAGPPLPEILETASGRRWYLRESDVREALAIEQTTEIDPLLARIVAARGVTATGAQKFLNPSLRESMPDPVVLMDMEKAVVRLEAAIKAGEGVGVFGDYDVDGTTASAILKLYFNAIGAPLDVYLPDRMTEGYGPNIGAFRTLKANGAKVIVTVDCGASAHEPVEAAAQEGLDVIILDHHQMDGPGPENAVAVVNPNRPDDISGLNNLSAAGVAFMAVVALNRALRVSGYFETRQEPDTRSLLDLVALGLVCDVMEITGLTRTLVAQGLKILGGGGNAGLKALGEFAGVKGAPTTYHLGFLLGPRINAAGRIGHARLGFELLTTDDPSKRRELAEKLHVMNAARQEIEAAVQADAIREIETGGLVEDDIIVVAGEGWHPGVIGIVAGRLKEAYDRPVIVIGLEGETGKGSGRSITGVDLGGAISRARQENYLVAGGGHAMAAGLTIARDGVAAFRGAMNEMLSAEIKQARLSRTSAVDGVIASSAVSKRFADMVQSVGPFGPGAPEPVFALTDLKVRRSKVVGNGHLSLTLASDAGDEVRAIAFRADGEKLGEILLSGKRIHVLGKVRADDWRGGDAGQLQISDAAIGV